MVWSCRGRVVLGGPLVLRLSPWATVATSIAADSASHATTDTHYHQRLRHQHHRREHRRRHRHRHNAHYRLIHYDNHRHQRTLRISDTPLKETSARPRVSQEPVVL